MIHVLLIYEKVTLVVPLEQRRFFNHLNDTISALSAKYVYPEPKLLFCGDIDAKNDDEDYRCDGCFEVFVKSLDEYIPIHTLYTNAIVNNILYLAGAGEEYRAEFLQSAEDAYNSYRKRSIGKWKRIKKGEW